MIPLVQMVVALAGVILSPQVLRQLGLLPPAGNDSSTTGRVYVMPDHPAAAAPTSSPVPTVPATPGTPAAPAAPGTLPQAPSFKQILADAVRNPWALAAGGVTLFAFVPAMAQLRAAGWDIAGATRSVYDEGRAANSRLNNADDYVDINRTRKYRGGRK